jgi:hypothetical protein
MTGVESNQGEVGSIHGARKNSIKDMCQEHPAPHDLNVMLSQLK